MVIFLAHLELNIQFGRCIAAISTNQEGYSTHQTCYFDKYLANLYQLRRVESIGLLSIRFWDHVDLQSKMATSEKFTNKRILQDIATNPVSV